MRMDLIDAALKVTTPLAFLSLIAALAYMGYARRLKHQDAKLDKLPEAQRAKATDEFLTRYGIDGKDLTKADRVTLIRDELDKRYRRSRELAILTTVAFVICFGVAVFAFLKQGSAQPDPPKEIGVIKGVIRSVAFEGTMVRAQVANQSGTPFDVNSGRLEADCGDTKIELTLTLARAGVGLVEPGRERMTELQARYKTYPLSPPPADRCSYRVTLDAANGGHVTKLSFALPRGGQVTKERLTLFEFAGTQANSDVYIEYKDALAAAEPIRAGDVDLVELARADIDQIPTAQADLEEIQKRSLSVALASGSVTKGENGFQLRSSLFVSGVPRQVRERLLNLQVLRAQDNGFYITRQLTEMAVYYALAWSAERKKKPGALEYLARARETAASLLQKTDLPPELRAAAEAWEAFLRKCLVDRNAAC
jgi:hypothetical protein